MITLKDLKLNCIGFRGYDDEWYPNSNYQAFLKVDSHHYHVKIWEEKKNKWNLTIHLCLTASNSRDIRITVQSARTMRELKQAAVDEINKYHNSEQCILDIEEWKKSHGKKVFDENFNYLGISYTNPEREKTNTEFDYYNDKKPDIKYGTYYMLEENSVMVCKIGCGWSSIHHDCDYNLREKLLQSLSCII